METSPEEKATLMASFSATEVNMRLSRMAKTAPGPDKVTYQDLRRTDPGCQVLALVYSGCLAMGRVPSSWKESTTILLFKDRDESNLSNWRPLSLGNCIAKLYTAILTDRITKWAKQGKRLTPEQKGFLQ